MSEEKFDSEGFEKLKAAFNEYEAEQRERFKNFSVGLLKRRRAELILYRAKCLFDY